MNKISEILIFLVVILLLFLIAPIILAEYYTGLCFSNSYQQCNGNYLYWYDSCGNQQGLIQYCSNGCLNNVCNNYSNYPSCNSHAYKECVGDSIYWYDSCSNRQDLYQNCSNYNLTCEYGQCVVKKISYLAHYKKDCYGDNIYWYDSLNALNDLYQNCSDFNSCTRDNCKTAKCSNILMCDGSTCVIGSDDYKKYCGSASCGNGICESVLGETENTCLVDCRINTDNQTNNLSISFFTKKYINSQQWDKSVKVGQNGIVYFMITLNNSSNSQIDNVFVSANIPSEISYLGNLTIDDIALSGDIISGINIGSIQPLSKKTVMFEGKTQIFNTQGIKEAVAFISSVEPYQSDTISINLDASELNSASITSTSITEAIWLFIKRWFMWIIAGLVMFFLFIMVFKRISSNV